MNRVGKSVPVDDLREAIKSEIEPGTELMSISVISPDPKFAQDMANTLAALLVEYVQQVNIGDNAGSRQIEDRLVALEADIEQDRQKLAGIISNNAVPDAEVEILKSSIEFKEDSYRNMLLLFHSTRLGEDLRARSVTIITPAALPNFPANGFGFREVGLGLIIGLFSGLGLALALENLDTRVYSSQQLENFTHLPVLATVPSGALPPNSLEDETSPRIARLKDAYRLLASNLYTLKEQMPLQTVVISSAVAQEGKSTVAVNLSQVLAERGQTVFLIETDMRHPSLSKKLGLNGHGSKEGLSNLLSDPGNIDQQKFSQILNITEQPSLFLLEGGSKVANPAALLASPRMNELLKYLGDQSQLTLIDSPPVLGMADVSVVAAKVDGVLLVVAEGASRREEITAAIKQLHSARSQVLGLVFIQKNGGNKVYN
jgi:capsular exopolysaccharide synthesis family protein